MPVWSNTPPTEGRGPSMRLRRTPGPGSLTAVVTATDMIGCATHFYRHRTVPCESPNCEACDAGYPWRWHAYLSALDAKTNEHFIFECTAQAADEFKAYRERHHTLLGCMFQSHRLGDHSNGRVLIRCRPADLTKFQLPHPPDLQKCLCHIWNIPTSETAIEGRLKHVDRVVVNRGANGPVAPLSSTTTSPK